MGKESFTLLKLKKVPGKSESFSPYGLKLGGEVGYLPPVLLSTHLVSVHL